MLEGSTLLRSRGETIGCHERRLMASQVCDLPRVHMSCLSSSRDSQCLGSNGEDVRSPSIALPAQDTFGKRVECGHI